MKNGYSEKLFLSGQSLLYYHYFCRGFFSVLYSTMLCFICRPSDSTVEDAIGSLPGHLRLLHCLSVTLTTRLDLIPVLCRTVLQIEKFSLHQAEFLSIRKIFLVPANIQKLETVRKFSVRNSSQTNNDDDDHSACCSFFG